MESNEERIKELEVKVDELESLNKNLEETLSQQLDENDIRIIVDKVFFEKDNATNDDVDLKINKYQIRFIKWLIGTSVSVIAIVISIVRFLL